MARPSHKQAHAVMAPTGTLKARIKKESEKPSGLKVRAFVLRGEPAPAESRARFCDDA